MEERNFCWPFWPTLCASFCPLLSIFRIRVCYLKYSTEGNQIIIEFSANLSPFTFSYFSFEEIFEGQFFRLRFPPNCQSQQIPEPTKKRDGNSIREPTKKRDDNSIRKPTKMEPTKKMDGLIREPTEKGENQQRKEMVIP